MKKTALLVLLLGVLSFIGCSNTSGNSEGTGNQSSVTDGSVTAPAEEGKVIYLNTENFRKLVWDYKANPDTFIYRGTTPAIIDFYADWCRPCKMVAPIMDELATEYKGKLTIYKVNTDLERELSATFAIRSIPAILYIPMQGKPQMSVGAQQKPSYVQMINDFLKVK